ncbi:MAG: hypothetical protein ACI4SL_02725 [Candidatus Ornithospirochaeta sp.]
MYDLPLMGIFEYNKEFTAYSLKVLAGIDVVNIDEMQVKVENFLAPAKDGRAMRMDARINLLGDIRTDIEIQKFRNKDELARALYYLGGLLVDYRKGLETIPNTRCIVVFICDFDPFEGTEDEGKTRMRYILRSEDDSAKFDTVGGRPYPFEGVTVLLYNGAKNWNEDEPRSDEEEAVRIYLSDMKKADPKYMESPIASKAVDEYKGDPVIMDKVKRWVEETFKDKLEARDKEWEEKMKAQEEKHAKEINDQEEKHEKEMNDQKEGYENRLDRMIRKLISEGKDDEYISEFTSEPMERVKEIRQKMS